MKVMIGGCGRVGSTLANELDADGHDVAIIDKNPTAFRRLSKDYGGQAVRGVVFERRVLEQAGVATTDAFLAVTSGDNSNIVSARIAREHFTVPQVVARIYDPDRAEIFERHGITTIAAARWTADAFLALLQSADRRRDGSIGPGQGDVVLVSHDLPGTGGPWEAASFTAEGRWLLAAVSRTGQTTVATPRELLQAGERLHLVVQRAELAAVDQFLIGLTGASDKDRP